MSRVRLADRLIAAVALGVLSPVLLLLAVIVRLGSRGPAWHRSVRAGLGGAPFTMYKFRSMVIDAPNLGTRVTASGDPRVTLVGRAMRATKLDELPQLVNVVRGEMGLVGARPEDPHYVDLSDPAHVELYSFPPGITGPASIEYRREEELLAAGVTAGDDHEVVYCRIAREKMELDLVYLRGRTLRTDLLLVLRTLLGRPKADKK
jgi:lipopolysaccharide/colanic/teichoic acid biosynthesis glycosyltransferase